MSKFWSFKNLGDEDIELRVEGEIVSDDDAWIYEWFGIPAATRNAFRQELSQYAGKNITVWIDSWGGDVFAAAGIYNALKEHKGKVTVKVDGKAVSAASVIAMSGDEIYMSPVSIMMIHNPWSRAVGEAKDMRHAADVLDVVKDTIMNAYQARTGLDRDEISKMMDEETWMSAQKAMSAGFVDGVLYTEPSSDDEPVQNSYSFSRMAIQNSANAAMKRFLDQWKAIDAAAQATSKEPQNTNEGESDNMSIMNVEDLKKEYPQLCNQLVDQAVKDAVTAERNRIKEIEEIANTVSPELVNKAKFEEPMNAEKLAFVALKQDSGRGEAFINARQQELQNNNSVKSQEFPGNDDQKKVQEASQIDAIANAMNARRGGMEAKN
ncbi:head maturation protease, ClpP-related [Paenibacillus campinasensis]|uniref:ATP-dependent Clp protease proteolytic subunit n=1 Tax=Paenibacillus campinasensis TaxID=66347 RepID=A0A268ELA4_9BACL|nr:head maturation protease, ClpP-related [Paenibacillus campinasensis]PAD73903.1 hypothetical protein CHH67_18890 [Paenibacillus campinasensis]